MRRSRFSRYGTSTGSVAGALAEYAGTARFTRRILFSAELVLVGKTCGERFGAGGETRSDYATGEAT